MKALFLAIAGVTLIACAALAQTSARRPKTVTRTKPAVVMIVAVAVRDGALFPVSSGSGTIVSPDGDILTNAHVLANSRTSKTTPLFVVGRYHTRDREPQFVCAGKSSDSNIDQALDLAVIRCSMDMSGRPFSAKNWPAAAIGRSERVVVGEQLWILGYPNVGGSTIHVTSGLVSGWTGETGGAGSRAYMKTDAVVAHGNSGGSAINASGQLVGVPSAFMVRAGTGKRQVAKVGLVRPIEHARSLLPARTTSVTAGSIVRGQVLSADNGKPIPSAMIIVLEPGIDPLGLGTESLNDHTLTWAHSNAAGSFRTSRPIPRGQKYSVVVTAPGYRSRVLKHSLEVPADAAFVLEPWPAIRLTR